MQKLLRPFVAAILAIPASASELMPAVQQNALVRKYCAVCHTSQERRSLARTFRRGPGAAESEGNPAEQTDRRRVAQDGERSAVQPGGRRVRGEKEQIGGDKRGWCTGARQSNDRRSDSRFRSGVGRRRGL